MGIHHGNRAFLGSVPGSTPAEHYELHVWLWRNNPLGMFAPYNPKVSC